MFLFFLHKYLSMGLLGCMTGACLLLIRNCWVIFQSGYSILHTCNTRKRSKIKFLFTPFLIISIDCGCIERKGEDGIEMHTLSQWVMLFVYTQNIYFSARKWLKRVFGCLARLCPEFRAALQISSENLLGQKSLPRPLRQFPVSCCWRHLIMLNIGNLNMAHLLRVLFPSFIQVLNCLITGFF